MSGRAARAGAAVTRDVVAAAAVAAVVVVVAPGCRSKVVAPPPAPPVAPPVQSSAPPRTTAGSIAINNLEGEVDTLERQLAAAPDDGERRAGLVSRLLARAQVLGRLGDYDRALALADEGVKRRPRDGASYLTRARVRERLHLFHEALADLDAAAHAGSNDPAIELVRAAVMGATGRENAALAIYGRARAAFPDIVVAGSEAALVGRRGDAADVSRAEGLFALARSVYRDVSPLPVAWLELQEGLFRERRGDAAGARASYEAACARLPAYVEAQAHLARLEAVAGAAGDRGRALQRLRAVTAASDDPQYLGQLAALLAEDGRADEAGAAARRATARFDELLASHRAAFAAHAARFWLGPGRTPTRALALAEENVRLAPNADARMLVLEASAAVRREAQVSVRAGP
jgi:tetratricopeptide (TPR) repeat protein